MPKLPPATGSAAGDDDQVGELSEPHQSTSPSDIVSPPRADTPFSRGWEILLRSAPGTPVLEASDDDGERARALTRAGSSVTCVRATDDVAERVRSNGFVCHVSADGRIDADERFDRLVLSAALGATAGSEWPTSDLANLTTGLVANLTPGATVIIALPNPLYQLPLLGRAKSLALGRAHRPAPRRRGRSGPTFIRADQIFQSLGDAGLLSIRLFAALPVASKPKFLVPLAEPEAVAFFFRQLLPRPSSRLRRLLVRGVAQLADFGWLDRVVPDFEIAAVTRGR